MMYDDLDFELLDLVYGVAGAAIVSTALLFAVYLVFG